MNRVYVYATHGERYVLVRGMIRNWLQRQRIPVVWSPSRKGFWVRQERLADVVALLEHDGYAVRVKDRKRDVPHDRARLGTALSRRLDEPGRRPETALLA